jgi:hypothetical protein
MSLPISSRPTSTPLPRPDRLDRTPKPTPPPAEVVHDSRPRTTASAPAISRTSNADRLERPVTLSNNHLGTQLAATSGQASQQRATPGINSTWGAQVRQLPNGGTLTTTTSQAPGLSSTQTVLRIPNLPEANSERVVTQRELPNGGTLTTESVGGTVENSRVDIPGVSRSDERAREAIEKVFEGGFIEKRSNWEVVGKIMTELNPHSIENQVNFFQGAFNAATGTVRSLTSDLPATVKGVGDLVNNPVLNPIRTVAKSIATGESPLPEFQRGWDQFYGMGQTVADGYQEEYRENGSAGVAGSIGFDVGLAFLPGGAGASTARGAARTAASAFKPSASDVAAAAANNAGDKVSWREALGAWSPL